MKCSLCFGDEDRFSCSFGQVGKSYVERLSVCGEMKDQTVISFP